MPPKKKDTGSKGGRPTGAKTTKVGGQVAEADLHPEFQSNWMELKPMVFYKNLILKTLDDCTTIDIVMIYLQEKFQSKFACH